ncbi:BASS family bile acid:Na+ symporter [Roseibium hamelinense]|uniref:BASS family bile acid:Na+ symporter n=1 Tax=Roseibium hamelinense TaxID=150831 RepID=A0A562SBM5_9HYPH|nr:bile acid:sodium symporter [Roseibium hamelinense]MTI42169.1 transporter [Roseibium hamelinense]TWI78729.1 BASS family bile acid:Na+ symporter [Roseibium hamelinense]
MIGQFEQILSAIIVFIIMLGMGASLSPTDYVRALKKPKALGIGLACQFGVMPLLGYILITLLPLTEAIAIGVLIMACMPGGTTSNMFTYFAKGNLALSILMTVSSTVSGVILIPIIISLYAASLDLTIPRENIVITLVLLLVPVAIGTAIRLVNETAARTTETVGSMLGILFIVFLIVAWVPRNWNFLQSMSIATYFAAVVLGLAGIIIGYLIALVLKLNSRDARTVGLETGLQNGPLAFGIIAFTFSGEQQQSYMAVPALYSVVILLVASTATFYFRQIDSK